MHAIELKHLPQCANFDYLAEAFRGAGFNVIKVEEPPSVCNFTHPTTAGIHLAMTRKEKLLEAFLLHSGDREHTLKVSYFYSYPQGEAYGVEPRGGRRGGGGQEHHRVQRHRVGGASAAPPKKAPADGTTDGGERDGPATGKAEASSRVAADLTCGNAQTIDAPTAQIAAPTTAQSRSTDDDSGMNFFDSRDVEDGAPADAAHAPSSAASGRMPVAEAATCIAVQPGNACVEADSSCASVSVESGDDASKALDADPALPGDRDTLLFYGTVLGGPGRGVETSRSLDVPHSVPTPCPAPTQAVVSSLGRQAQVSGSPLSSASLRPATSAVPGRAYGPCPSAPPMPDTPSASGVGPRAPSVDSSPRLGSRIKKCPSPTSTDAPDASAPRGRGLPTFSASFHATSLCALPRRLIRLLLDRDDAFILDRSSDSVYSFRPSLQLRDTHNFLSIDLPQFDRARCLGFLPLVSFFTLCPVDFARRLSHIFSRNGAGAHIRKRSFHCADVSYPFALLTHRTPLAPFARAGDRRRSHHGPAQALRSHPRPFFGNHHFHSRPLSRAFTSMRSLLVGLQACPSASHLHSLFCCGGAPHHGGAPRLLLDRMHPACFTAFSPISGDRIVFLRVFCPNLRLPRSEQDPDEASNLVPRSAAAERPFLPLLPYL